MSIGVQCFGCGRRYRVSDDRAGGKMACQCGKVIDVDGPRYADKLCVMCGIDVSSLTRTRDPNGNYYCQPCWAEALRAQRERNRAGVEPEFRWVTYQLSLLARRTIRPLIILATVGLLWASWYWPQIGLICGGTSLVAGVCVLALWLVWMYALPFRDGPATGWGCIVSSAQRKYWAKRNPDFDLRRPLPLMLTGIAILLVSAAFLAVWRTQSRRGETTPDVPTMAASRPSSRPASAQTPPDGVQATQPR